MSQIQVPTTQPHKLAIFASANYIFRFRRPRKGCGASPPPGTITIAGMVLALDVPHVRSRFRQNAPAALTPSYRLKFNFPSRHQSTPPHECCWIATIARRRPILRFQACYKPLIERSDLPKSREDIPNGSRPHVTKARVYQDCSVQGTGGIYAV